MNIKKLSLSAVAASLLSVVSVVSLSSLAAAEDLIALVPVRVNVAAAVSLEPPPGLNLARASLPAVAAGSWDTLKITNRVSVLHGRQNAARTSSVRYSRGAVSLELDPRQYGNASLALYSVSGKRVMSGKASATGGAFNISRSNIAPGVYLLSIKGDGGSSYSTKLTHGGGRLNISAAFAGGDVRSVGKEARALSAAMSSAEDWTLTVTAEGYRTREIPVVLLAGLNPPHDITLVLVDPVGEPLIDSRDQKTYKTVTIGTQTWMAENLNYRNTAGSSDTVGACYNNSADSCSKYGRLYRWVEVMGIAERYEDRLWSGSDVLHRGICPEGWHVPNAAEWDVLMALVGGWRTAGTKLKATSGWRYNSNGTDEFSFAALPGGYSLPAGNPPPHSFGGIEAAGYWWSSTEYEATFAGQMYTGGGDVTRPGGGDGNMIGGWNIKFMGQSVRCLRD